MKGQSMDKATSAKPLKTRDGYSEEEIWILQRLLEEKATKGETLLDGLLEQGLPNQPSILRELNERDLIAAQSNEKDLHNLAEMALYDVLFSAKKKQQSTDLLCEPTVYSLDTIEGNPRDSFSIGVGEVYANITRIVAELPSQTVPLLDKGNPSLGGFARLSQETFPQLQERGSKEDWFDDPILFCVLYVQGLLQKGILIERAGKLDVVEDQLHLFDLSPLNVVRALYTAFLDSEREWDYLLAMGRNPHRRHANLRVPSSRSRRLTRRFVASFLPRIPQGQWLGLEGLIELIYGQHRDLFGRESTALHTSQLGADKLRRGWDHAEGLYLRWMLRTAMPAFGVLDKSISQRPDTTTVRVPGLTKDLLLTSMDPPSPAPKPFICQPTMDILVMTDRAVPQDLISLSGMAHKTRADVASLYTLNEESFHKYLLVGGTAQDAIEFLKERSSQPLPQNLISALQDWEGRFGRVLIYPRVSVLEFDNLDEREAFLGDHPSAPTCRRAGDRYAVLLGTSSEGNASVISGSSLIDYNKPPPPVFLQKAEHVLEVQLSYADLFAVPEAALFAELARKTEEAAIFEITPGSVKNSPLDSNRIVRILENRLAGRLSSGLPLRIKAWRGELPSLRMEQCIVLQVEDEKTLHGLLKLPHLKELAVGTLGQKLLVVETNRLRELERVLDAHHIDVQKGLRLHRFAKEPAKHLIAKEESVQAQPPGTLKLSTQGTRKLLQGAIREGREVEIWVIEADGRPPRRRLITPKAIRYKGHTPLVTCILVEEAVERTYRIGHIKGLRMLSRRSR